MFDFKKPMHAPTITKLASAAPGRQVSTGQNADSGCRDGGNARCKSIKTIDEVDDVREGNQIEDGKGIR